LLTVALTFDSRHLGRGAKTGLELAHKVGGKCDCDGDGASAISTSVGSVSTFSFWSSTMGSAASPTSSYLRRLQLLRWSDCRLLVGLVASFLGPGFALAAGFFEAGFLGAGFDLASSEAGIVE
jgi:hypothetical protein